MKITTVLSTVFTLSILVTSSLSAAVLGPTHYTQVSDSPFSGLSFDYFYLEDFEDHLLNTPGVSANSVGGLVTSTSFSGSIIDSVDADDGSVNGVCSNCDSYFASGSTGITFTFDANVLGMLPTHVGIVWTDGDGTTFFEAFDQADTSLGSVGPVTIATSGYYGQIDEDSFFGATNTAGISSIFISNSSGGIEVDHLQYGYLTADNGGMTTVPVPAPLALLGLGLLGLSFSRKKPF